MAKINLYIGAFNPAHEANIHQKFEDLLTPTEQLVDERKKLWDKWVWETGSQEDWNRIQYLDQLIEKQRGLIALFEKMITPV